RAGAFRAGAVLFRQLAGSDAETACFGIVQPGNSRAGEAGHESRSPMQESGGAASTEARYCGQGDFEMNAHPSLKPTAILERDITPEGGDYEIVRRVSEKISLDYRDQHSLEELADEVGQTPTGLQKLFTRWAGLSPKAFLQAVTL